MEPFGSAKAADKSGLLLLIREGDSEVVHHLAPKPSTKGVLWTAEELANQMSFTPAPLSSDTTPSGIQTVSPPTASMALLHRCAAVGIVTFLW